MKYLFSILFFAMISLSLNAQSAVGKWKTIDDEDGKVKSHVEIFEKDGKLFGKVSQLINPEITICENCDGDKKNQPIEGMQIMWNLEKESNSEWGGGKILDPKTGKIYKCNVELVETNTLNVRGYIGFSLLGRTQTWYRVE